MKDYIGITSTVPVEIIFAAGLVPVDINNIFILSDDPNRLVRIAKMDGFPDTTCSWICGLYGTVLEKGLKTIIGVVGGDCSETIALMEILSLNDIEIIPFAYPHQRDKKILFDELQRFSERFDVDMKRALKYKKKLDVIRARIHYLDRLLWKEDRALGEEVHHFQLSSSDFNGDPDEFYNQINHFIKEVEKRDPFRTEIRLGFLGVPPIISDLYSRIEDNNVRIVYNEVQRQFSLPVPGSIVDSYYHYTYPYGIDARLSDIEREINHRKIDGVIHYIQSFCFRGIEDIVLRKRLKIPVLTLQGDIPSRVTEIMEIRIEAFLDMLYRRKEKK